MFKNPKMKVAAWAVLLGLLVWVIVAAQQEPDVAAQALEQIPDECEVVGVWRDVDQPDTFVNTTVLCADQMLHVVLDEGGLVSWQLDADGWSPPGDRYVVLPDGSLQVSDEFGVIKTLPPHGSAPSSG